MALPTTRSQFKQFVLRMLGEPVTRINVADEQVEDRIDEALQFWKDYHHEAYRRTFLRHQVTQQNIDDGYIELPENVLSVARVFNNSIVGSLTLYNQQYLLNLSDAARMDILSYYMATQNLDIVERVLSTAPTVIYQRHDNRLSFEGDVIGDVKFPIDSFIAIECFVAMDETTLTDVWTDRILQKLAAAYVKRQWGTNLMKFTGVPLTSGVQLNGDRIYQDAMAEITDLEESFQKKYEDPLGFYIG